MIGAAIDTLIVIVLPASVGILGGLALCKLLGLLL